MARMLYLRDIEVDVHVRCRACGHEGVLPRADMNRRFGPNYPVLSIAPHYRCSRCNSRDTESRPAPPPFATPVTAMPMAEDAPSFAGPLAALQGLLDAMRTRDDPADEPDAEDAAPWPHAPAAAPPAARPAPDTPAPDLDLGLDLESDLERLAADDDFVPESGRRPLWEPVSLADLAGHDDEDAAERDGDDTEDEDWPPRRWTLQDRDADPDDDEEADRATATPPPPAPAAPTIRTAAGNDPDEDASRSFDRTIAALRSILDGRGDGPRAEETAAPPAPFPPPAFAAAPAFSLKDTDSQADETEADPPEADLRDEDDAEPSTDDILGFAIRDPDNAPPPWERAPERAPSSAGGEPLDRTIAALRSMVQKAAADRDEGAAGNGTENGDEDDGVVTPLFGRSRVPAFERDDDPEEDAEDRKADAAAADDDAFWRRDEADDDADGEAGPDDDAPPAPRKSVQEQDMEEALRALRALVEAESDLDDPPGPAWKSEADPLPGFKPLPRRAPEADDEGEDVGKGDEEPLDLAEPAPMIQPEQAKPAAGKRGDSNETGKKAAKDESGTLGKTLAALRNMLELDGKQGR